MVPIHSSALPCSETLGVNCSAVTKVLAGRAVASGCSVPVDTSLAVGRVTGDGDGLWQIDSRPCCCEAPEKVDAWV
jgi:hypothetical protein